MVARLRLVQTSDRTLNQLQQNVKQVLDPVAANPLVDGIILNQRPALVPGEDNLLSGLVLVTGLNTINHTLGRPLRGWFVIRWRGAYATLYDTQDLNQTPERTLLITASAGVTVDLYVF